MHLISSSHTCKHTRKAISTWYIWTTVFSPSIECQSFAIKLKNRNVNNRWNAKIAKSGSKYKVHSTPLRNVYPIIMIFNFHRIEMSTVSLGDQFSRSWQKKKEWREKRTKYREQHGKIHQNWMSIVLRHCATSTVYKVFCLEFQLFRLKHVGSKQFSILSCLHQMPIMVQFLPHSQYQWFKFCVPVLEISHVHDICLTELNSNEKKNRSPSSKLRCNNKMEIK